MGALGDAARSDLVKTVRNGVEVVVEQVGVRVECHRCRRVPEHPLHGLHVRARAHRKAGRGMPEIVDRDPRERRIDGLRFADRTHEPAISGMRPREVRLAVTEHELVSPLTGDLARKALQEKPRERHTPRLMGLRRPDHDPRRHFDRVLLDPRPTALQVEVPDAEPGHFTPTHARVRERVDEGGMLRHQLHKQLDLFDGEVYASLRGLAGEQHPTSGIARDASIPDRAVEDAGEHPMCSLDLRGRSRFLTRGSETANPCLHLRVADLPDRAIAPRRHNVHPPRDLERLPRRGLEVGTVREPLGPELPDRHPRRARVDVLAASGRDGHTGEVLLGVDLPTEPGLLPRLMRWIPVSDAIPPTRIGLIRLNAAHVVRPVQSARFSIPSTNENTAHRQHHHYAETTTTRQFM